jgi:hypothetical protein
MLRLHPDVEMPCGRKELHYYTNGLWKGRHWYLWHFRFGLDRIKGDVTPKYALCSSRSVQAMQAMNPQANILFILRDPCERAWSMAYMDLVKSPGRLLDEVPNADFANHFSSDGSRRRGSYSETLQRYQDSFGSKQVHVLWYDDLLSDPVAFLDQVFCILGIDRNRFPADAKVNERSNVGGVPLPDNWRRELQSSYKLELDKLREIVQNDDQPDWLLPIPNNETMPQNTLSPKVQC